MSIRERFYRRIHASFKSDMRKLLNDLLDQGWRIEPTAGAKGHFYAYPPDKNMPQVLLAGTPSDARGWDNMIARLKRSGFDQDAVEAEDPADVATFESVVQPERFRQKDYAEEQQKAKSDEMAEFLFDEVGAGAPKEEIHQVIDMINEEEMR